VCQVASGGCRPAPEIGLVPFISAAAADIRVLPQNVGAVIGIEVARWTGGGIGLMVLAVPLLP